MKILVMNGPNLNMLGIREKNIYGAETYDDLKELVEKTFAEQGVEGEIYQSNHEGAMVDRIQQAYFDGTDAVEGAQKYGIAGSDLTYADLVRFWSQFDDLNLTTLLVSPVVMAKILTLDEVKDSVCGDYMTTGRITSVSP